LILLIKTTRRIYLFIICLVALNLFLPVQTPAKENKKSRYFNALQERLIHDGFNKDRINTIYKSPKIDFDASGISLFFKHSEGKLNYDQFASKRSIKKTKKYLEKHRVYFEKTEKAYSVDKEIIAAIILVETRLGTFLGRRSVLNTLSTMASLKDADMKSMLWRKISNSSPLTKKEFDKKADKKAKWAYSELKAFLRHTNKENINPLTVYGSYAGAMGIAQFMPSNILILAKDGDSDGCIDLFNHADAIASIANYLKNHGWQKKTDNKKAYKILLHYNRSKYYANIILKIARLLKG